MLTSPSTLSPVQPVGVVPVVRVDDVVPEVPVPLVTVGTVPVPEPLPPEAPVPETVVVAVPEPDGPDRQPKRRTRDVVTRIARIGAP